MNSLEEITIAIHAMRSKCKNGVEIIGVEVDEDAWFAIGRQIILNQPDEKHNAESINRILECEPNLEVDGTPICKSDKFAWILRTPFKKYRPGQHAQSRILRPKRGALALPH